MTHLNEDLLQAIYAAELQADLCEFCDLVDLLSKQIPVSELLAVVGGVYKSKRDGTLVGSRFSEIGTVIEQLGLELHSKYGV